MAVQITVPPTFLLWYLDGVPTGPRDSAPVSSTPRNLSRMSVGSEWIDTYIDIRHIWSVIRKLVGKTTQDIYDVVNSRQVRKVPREVHGRARRLMDQLNAAPTLDFLKIPPRNRLEKL